MLEIHAWGRLLAFEYVLLFLFVNKFDDNLYPYIIHYISLKTVFKI